MWNTSVKKDGKGISIIDIDVSKSASEKIVNISEVWEREVKLS